MNIKRDIMTMTMTQWVISNITIIAQHGINMILANQNNTTIYSRQIKKLLTTINIMYLKAKREQNSTEQNR
jgi:hypothetical protein